jgi:trigger factor
VIAQPEIDITQGEEEGPVAFDAVVEVRPHITVEGYGGLEVTVPRPDATDADVDERVEATRRQHAEFEPADRPATTGDQVRVDIAGSQAGEAQEGLTADDYLYEVGSGAVVPELDARLLGAKAGDILEFDAAHPQEGEEGLHFRILVKEVRASRLPELTDEWVGEVTDHATVEAWRAGLADQLGRQRLVAANMALQQRVAESLAALVEDEPPEAMVDQEVMSRVQNLANRLRQQGADLSSYLQMTGRSAEDVVAEYRGPAVQAIKVDLALRAIAEAEGLEVTEDDLSEHFARMASQYGQSAESIRENFERAGQMLAVRSEISKGKALDWVLDRVATVDEEGNPVDRDALKFPDAEAEPETNEDPDADPEEEAE